MTQLDRRNRATMSLLGIVALFLVACSCGFNPFAREAEAPMNPNFAGAEFGAVVTAGAVGQDNVPMDVRSTFSRLDPIIYVVAEVERVEAGTTVFARWFRDGAAFEDTDTITADRTYTDTYLEFHIEPEAGTTLEVLEPGDYTVQIYINGNPGPQAEFEVE